jgi:hypothetical protein
VRHAAPEKTSCAETWLTGFAFVRENRQPPEFPAAVFIRPQAWNKLKNEAGEQACAVRKPGLIAFIGKAFKDLIGRLICQPPVFGGWRQPGGCVNFPT